jgi:adenylate kinase family enzyme
LRKILVIGSGGAGKSTLATRLSEKTKIEVIHLDRFYWHPGWVETPKADWRKTVENLIKFDSWIMDGNYSGTLDIRIEACDTVIFLDFPPRICLWRLIKRVLQYRDMSRPDMATGCQERFNLKFLFWVYNYQKRTKPKIVELLQNNSNGRKIVWLRSNEDVERFLASVVSS